MPAPPGRAAGIGGGTTDDRGFGPGGSQGRSNRDRQRRDRERQQQQQRQVAAPRPSPAPPPPAAPAPSPSTASPVLPGAGDIGTTGLGTMGRERRRRAGTLLTLGLADTAKKTLLGI